MSNYLSTPGAFEQAINRGWLSTRSPELDRLVEAIDLFVKRPSQGRIFDVSFKWKVWQRLDPKEFFDRGRALLENMNQEVKAQLTEWDPGGDLNDDELEALPGDELQMPAAPAVAMNRWNRLKKVANASRSTASKVVTAAGHAAVIGSVTAQAGIPGSQMAAAAVGAAVSATGIGATVVPVAIQVGTTYLAVKSYCKTESHLKNLLAIYHHRKEPPCNPVGFVLNPAAVAVPSAAGDPQHNLIADTVLPYLIQQKAKKRKRKAVAALPLIGSLEGARAVMNKTYKWGTNDLGKDRENAAGLLAAHFIQFDCPLSQAIVAELYSVEEMEWMKSKELNDVTKFLGDKMKSV